MNESSCILLVLAIRINTNKIDVFNIRNANIIFSLARSNATGPSKSRLLLESKQ